MQLFCLANDSLCVFVYMWFFVCVFVYVLLLPLPWYLHFDCFVVLCFFFACLHFFFTRFRPFKSCHQDKYSTVYSSRCKCAYAKTFFFLSLHSISTFSTKSNGSVFSFFCIRTFIYIYLSYYQLVLVAINCQVALKYTKRFPFNHLVYGRV